MYIPGELRLPTGEMAATQEDYVDAWYRFSWTLARELELRVLEYGPSGILFADKSGKTAKMSTWLALKVYKATTGAHFSEDHRYPHIYRCSICGQNQVDAESGKDGCDVCDTCQRALDIIKTSP